MTFQIVLVGAIEEGPVTYTATYLPTAYETRALAVKLAERFEQLGWCDTAHVVAYGGDWRARAPIGSAARWAYLTDEVPF